MTTGRINQVAQEHWHDCLQPLGIHSSQHPSVAVCYSYSTCRGLGLPSVLQPQLHAIITTNSATNDDECHLLQCSPQKDLPTLGNQILMESRDHTESRASHS